MGLQEVDFWTLNIGLTAHFYFWNKVNTANYRIFKVTKYMGIVTVLKFPSVMPF